MSKIHGSSLNGLFDDIKKKDEEIRRLRFALKDAVGIAKDVIAVSGTKGYSDSLKTLEDLANADS